MRKYNLLVDKYIINFLGYVILHLCFFLFPPIRDNTCLFSRLNKCTYILFCLEMIVECFYVCKIIYVELFKMSYSILAYLPIILSNVQLQAFNNLFLNAIASRRYYAQDT